MFSRRRGQFVALVSIITALLVVGSVSTSWADEVVPPSASAPAEAAETTPEPEAPTDDGEPVGGDAGVGETTDESSPVPTESEPGSIPDSTMGEPDAGEPAPTEPSQELPAPPPKADSPSAPTESEASLIARANGHNVVVDSATTQTTLVEALPDGTFQMTSTVVPARVEQDGGWVDIDTTLTATGTGYLAPVATTVPVQFSGGGTGPAIRVQLPSGEWFTESLELGALPSPTIEGASATYGNMIPDVDLRLTATATGMTEVLIVKTPVAAADPRVETLKLKINGASIATSPDGGTVAAPTGSDTIDRPRSGSPTVDEVDADAMLRANEPMVWDSSDPTSGPAGPGGNTIAAPVDSMITGTNTLTVDVASVADDDTVYPLYIDPDFGSLNLQAWSINQTYPNTHYYNVADDSDGRGNQIVGYLPAGWTQPYPGDGQQQWGRSFWQMSTAGSAGRHIIHAEFRVRQSWNSSCASTSVRLFRATNIPSAGASWNESTGVVYNGPSDVVSTNYGSNCAGQSWVGMDATQAVIDNGTGQAIIFALAASDETHESWKRFNLDAGLVVTFNSIPSSPTALTMTSPPRACGTSWDPVYINSSVPFTLRATLSDPDAGDNVSGRFRVMLGTDGGINAIPNQAPAGYISTGSQQSGLAHSVTISPNNNLADNTLYAWGVTARDNYDSSGEPLCFFKTKNTAPPLPQIGTTPAGPLTVGKEFLITVQNPPSAQIAAYVYWWTIGDDSAAPTMLPVISSNPKLDPLPTCPSGQERLRFACPNSSGVATISVAPLSESSTLWVAAYDKAMNVSRSTGSAPFTPAAGRTITANADTTNVAFGPGHGWRTAIKAADNSLTTVTPSALFLDANTVTTGTVTAQKATLKIGTSGTGFPFNETSTGLPPANSTAVPVFKDLGGVALNRINDPSIPDHAVTAAGALPAGYSYFIENQLGQMLPIGSDNDQTTGLLMLHSCRQPSGNEFATTTSNCDGKSAVSTDLGWIWPSVPPAAKNSNGTTSPTPSAPIYRCRIGNDQFVSNDAGCEGQTYELQLGWLWNRTSMQTDRGAGVNAAAVDTTKSFTVSAWVKPSQPNATRTYNTIVSQRGASASNFTLAEVPGPTSTSRVLRFCMRPQAATAGSVCATDTAHAVNDGDWMFVMGIWDAANKQIRLVRFPDAQSAAVNSYVPPAGEGTSSYPLSIGSGFNNDARVNMWGGMIANVTIFPGVASQTQISNLYNLKAPNTGPPPTEE